ncbi:MAG: acetyltransferase [Parvularculaceae bacterium]
MGDNLNIAFRPIAPADFEAVHGLWERAVRATHDFLSEAEIAEISAQVRDAYLPNAPLLLAVDGEKILAFMGMTGSHIDALFVDPAAFGRGVGRALIGEARKRGRPVTVDVNEDNPGAVAFYEKMGFERIGRSETDDQGRPFPLLHLQDQA